ncbi:hypothetical protein O181_076091 [Austropuccinia psidii MF-1]|uniref:Transcription initiation factor IIF subunit alpha n=1 Tax=Austropuccinia psidii MF-1 TaxID=1389203 RepID=A0A9Q3FFM5_9BASI|nr:hypothetical protein [Austropuccinia psidii MF-1]
MQESTPTAQENTLPYLEYALISAYDPKFKNNVLKFAPSSNKSVRLNSFLQPVKLNRKDPWAIRKKAQDEKDKAEETKLKSENAIKTEDETKPATDLKETANNKPTRDESLVAPAPASQPRFKSQPFKKKTKQVFIATDQAARMLKKEEYQSWLLEDSSSNGERWVGRYESAGASSSQTSTSVDSGKGVVPSDTSNYVFFRLDQGGEAFQVIPCHRFYRFTQRPSYDTLGADEAEAAYEKMQKPTTKEDLGRWFMRRRANPSGSTSTSSNGITVKREGSVKPSILDESKVSFGSRTSIRPQVEAISIFGKGKFTAIHGSQTSHMKDEDEDIKPKLGQDGDFDEFDYNEEFADDEEGAGNLNDEAMEEDELKELEDRMKREMLAAGKAGDDERDKDAMDIDKDDLFGEREDLTKEGRAVKKLLMRKVDNDVYESDDEAKNPYASEEDESDFEEVIPPITVASPSDPNNNSVPRSETPVPGSNNLNLPGGSRNLNKPPPARPTNIKTDRPHVGPSSRSGTPALSGQSRANSSPRPTNGGGSNTSLLPRSRSSTPNSIMGTPSSGKRKHQGSGSGKEKRRNPEVNGSIPNSPSSDQKNSKLITEQEVKNILKIKSMSIKDLLLHFKVKLKEDQRNKAAILGIIHRIAQMIGGQLFLKEGF